VIPVTPPQRLLLIVLACCSLLAVAAAQETALPNKQGSVKFALIGDMGTGDAAQLQTGAQLASWRVKFPFQFVLMLGDNVYGSQDFGAKFEVPYKALLDEKIPFYAALGNHDDQNEVFYKNYNMDGKRYYTFERGNVKFFVLDSTRMDRPQLEWLDKELASTGSEWKIAYFHHPLYSTGGTHGPEVAVREVVEPLFVKYGVDVVFAGHEHFYERIKPQKGILYFISGAGGQLRKGDLHRVDPMAAGYDQDRSFMLAEVDGHDMYYQAITRTGQVVDSGVFPNVPDPKRTTDTTSPTALPAATTDVRKP
jgi:predicted phosphodiesterase